MTLDEAIALVLDEGMKTEPVPHNAMAHILHIGHEPDAGHIEPLIAALQVIRADFRGQDSLNRGLATALYVLGAEANSYIALAAQARDPCKGIMFEQILRLMMAVDHVFYDK